MMELWQQTCIFLDRQWSLAVHLRITSIIFKFFSLWNYKQFLLIIWPPISYIVQIKPTNLAFVNISFINHNTTKYQLIKSFLFS